MIGDLFDTIEEPEVNIVKLSDGTTILHKYAYRDSADLMQELSKLLKISPFRNMVTAGGHIINVAMTNCGNLGWVSDRQGYRYSPIDPLTGTHWPKMPLAYKNLAILAAQQSGFKDFAPTVCLINKYLPGSKLSLHQDKNESTFNAPIVSVSLGILASFLLGGQSRSDKVSRIALTHGDVMVWGGPDRLRYHGVAPIKDGYHPQTGECRINLTFRQT